MLLCDCLSVKFWHFLNPRIQPDTLGFLLWRADKFTYFCLRLSELAFCHLQPKESCTAHWGFPKGLPREGTRGSFQGRAAGACASAKLFGTPCLSFPFSEKTPQGQILTHSSASGRPQCETAGTVDTCCCVYLALNPLSSGNLLPLSCGLVGWGWLHPWTARVGPWLGHPHWLTWSV